MGSMTAPHLGQAPSSSSASSMGAASMGVAAGSQLFGGMKPILLWRPVWAAPGLPELMSERGDVIVPEWGDNVSGCGRLSVLVSLLGMLQSLLRMLMSGQVILLSLPLGDSMSVRRGVVQFGGPLVVFVMRSVVITSGHD